MTHEIRLLFQTLQTWQQRGKRGVLVTVVDLDGSSYRRPGVRMIISKAGETVGAVSGGCVEAEIERQARSVFESGKARIMTYDGRLRIGCEGIIHILIEPVSLSQELLEGLESQLKSRQPFRMDAYYYHEVGEYENLGSLLTLNGKSYSLDPGFHPGRVNDQLCFSQSFDPLFQLYIFGAEHDAVQLSQSAKMLGWEVTVVASPEEGKSCDFFPGASALITPAFDEIDTSQLDAHTAVILMTHSFQKDVRYLMALKECQPAYIGLLGSSGRRERVLSMLLEHAPETSIEFIEQIHGPAGINIGAESASEIALSILSEILAVVRHQKPVSLKDKSGSIHG